LAFLTNANFDQLHHITSLYTGIYAVRTISVKQYSCEAAARGQAGITDVDFLWFWWKYYNFGKTWI